jgi:hypothetical protein
MRGERLMIVRMRIFFFFFFPLSFVLDHSRCHCHQCHRLASFVDGSVISDLSISWIYD